MKWYLAKIIYRIICGEGIHTPQFDEQLRLIHAEDEMNYIRQISTRSNYLHDACLQKSIELN